MLQCSFFYCTSWDFKWNKISISILQINGSLFISVDNNTIMQTPMPPDVPVMSLSISNCYQCQGLWTFVGEETATGLKSWERCHNRLLDRSQHKPQQLRTTVLHCHRSVCHWDMRSGRQSRIGLHCHLVDNWPTSLKSPAVTAMTISHHDLLLLPGSQNSNELTNTKTDLEMLWHSQLFH